GAGQGQGADGMTSMAMATGMDADALLCASAVRRHSAAILTLAQQGRARHFTFHPERMDVVAAYVAQLIRQRYPDLQVPYHSRWRHFEAGGVGRWAALAAWQGLAGKGSRLARARARIDLAVVSVLLDAGAGPAWRYADHESGQELARSEGLGVASLRWWAAGGLSSDPAQALQADAAGLARVQASDVARAFQVTQNNPLIGVEGRAVLLR